MIKEQDENPKTEKCNIYNQTKMKNETIPRKHLHNCFPNYTMANNTKTAAIKTEFIDIVTEGELLSSSVSATFSTIVTEASLIETPPIDGQINEKTITTLYDKVFVNAISYQAFTENKLRPWENALDTNTLTPCTPIISPWST